MPESLSPGLYLHVPFCRSKCPYCDFYSITSPELISVYLEALEREAELYKDSFASFDTLYLGGGTPSLLDSSQLGQLVSCLQRVYKFAREPEFTLEANPDDVTPEKLGLWRDLGINRLSLGVQSLNEDELRFLGRRHTAAQARRALETARAAGFGNLGVDLIYGLPGQGEGTWLSTLEQILAFRPEHLSCYQLTLKAGEAPALRTPMARQAARGEITPLTESEERGFFLLTSRFLTANGYLHYEVSNFAREERYCCRHNLKYWQHAPYLGLGPGAHSFDGRRRWWNFSSVAQYCAALDEGRAPRAGEETLNLSQFHLESLCLGFRTREGVGLDLIRRHPRWRAVLKELRRAGLVRVEDGRVVPTLEGLVVADRLPLRFVD